MASWIALARADLEVHLQAGRAPEIIERDHVERVRGGDDELPAVALGRDDLVLASDLLGHQPDHIQVEALQLLLRDRLLAELPAQVLEQDLLVQELHLDEDLAEPVPGSCADGAGLGRAAPRSERRR